VDTYGVDLPKINNKIIDNHSSIFIRWI